MKLSLLILSLFGYLVCTLPFLLTFAFAPNWTRKILVRFISFFSKIMLNILRVHIHLNGDVDKSTNYFIVSNHMSYLDILIISSLLPTSFVTSNEMRKTPLLGQITILGGCIFVERRSYMRLFDEISELEISLLKGLNVVVFPEAKSTGGYDVIRFKRALFLSAVRAQKPVKPLTIVYKSIDGEKVDSITKDQLCWYDGMNFVPHFLNLCRIKKIEIEVHVDEILNRDMSFENPGDLRDKSFELISKNYQSKKYF